MSFLLDTCVISDAARSANAGLEQWLRSQPPLDLHLSAVSLGEIRKGIELLPTGKKREKLRAWLAHDLRAQFVGRLLEVTSDVALECRRLTAVAQASGRPLPVVDGLLLATAQVHGLTFATRNALSRFLALYSSPSSTYFDPDDRAGVSSPKLLQQVRACRAGEALQPAHGGELRRLGKAVCALSRCPPATSATASFLNWGVNVRRIRLRFRAMRHLLESTY